MNALDGVIIGRGALTRAAEIVEEVAPTNRAFLCADTVVMDLLGDRVTNALTASGLQVRAQTFPPGEESKSLHVAADLYDWLAAQRAERREPSSPSAAESPATSSASSPPPTTAASRWSRSPPPCWPRSTAASAARSPSTCRPARTSSARSTPALRVIIDPDALATLPRPQLIADYAEVIKTAIIFDADLFDLIEASTDRLDDPALLAELVERCVRWKAKVVDEDPEDRGIRAILNYGHTIAHAIEATAGYGAYRHGEAVAIGMIGAGRLAQRTGRWSASDLTRQNNLLAAVGLPATFANIEPAQILDAMLRDKKVQNGRIRWVLPTTIGQATVNIELNPTLVTQTVQTLARSW